MYASSSALSLTAADGLAAAELAAGALAAGWLAGAVVGGVVGAVVGAAGAVHAAARTSVPIERPASRRTARPESRPARMSPSSAVASHDLAECAKAMNALSSGIAQGERPLARVSGGRRRPPGDRG